MKKPIKLTNAIVKGLPIPDKGDLVQGDSVITGLKVRIIKTGTRTFYLYYKFDGKNRKYRIGKFGDIGVPEAREVSKKLQARIALGEDPQETLRSEKKQRKVERASKIKTFLNEKYFPYAEEHQKTPGRTKQILNTNFGYLMDKQLDQITPWIMDKWQKDRLAKGIKPSTINRATTAIKAVLNKAVEWKIIRENPLGKRKRLKVVNGCLNPHVNGEHITVDMASMTEGALTPSFLFAQAIGLPASPVFPRN